MAIDWTAIESAGGIGKGTPRKRLKGRKDRSEAKVKRAVRAECVARDGYCLVARIAGWPCIFGTHGCSGPSEWAHLGGHRRSKTRGMPPELRHSTAHTAMLCRRHHQMEEAGKARVVCRNWWAGADGPVRWEIGVRQVRRD